MVVVVVVVVMMCPSWSVLSGEVAFSFPVNGDKKMCHRCSCTKFKFSLPIQRHQHNGSIPPEGDHMLIHVTRDAKPENALSLNVDR